MEINTPRLRLREFIGSDFPALCELDSHPEMHKYERVPPSEEETLHSLEEYIRSQHEVPRVQYRLAITIPPSDTVRGLIKLSRQWDVIREWETGWAVHPSEWGRGYAVEAGWYLINWGLHELDIHRVVAFCHTDNLSSVRVMEKLGMHRDGRLRETRWLNGRWWDEYIYSILEKEWIEDFAQIQSHLPGD
jgi:RimJ/RimL family protein N-acetyltransferase